ncbi:hypothetical protein B0H14DRAFT_988565 [Mycena olivaceomarginata]|nr:hypothetical protein B0H14DRAFT_988565 [Mycena olivaceomarginata]
MFFSASMALASLLSLSQLTVNSAPVTRAIVDAFCTGVGECRPLAGVGLCTNTPNIVSLVLNADADCAAFPLPDCQFDAGSGVLELFSDDSQNLRGKGIQSVQCFDNAGTVNGFTAGSEADIEQEAVDKANGIDIPV